MERRHAAILALDVVGYSRLMGTDEVGTHLMVMSDLNDLIIPSIAGHHGRVERVDGDGVIAEFPCATEAVRAAIAIQRAMPARNAERAEGRQMHFRIGVHAGQISSDGQMIYGQDVNIAARLETASEPGCIYVSETAMSEAAGPVGCQPSYIGRKTFKNIARPVGVFRIDAEGNAASRGPRAIHHAIARLPTWRARGLDNIRRVASVFLMSAVITAFDMTPAADGAINYRAKIAIAFYNPDAPDHASLMDEALVDEIMHGVSGDILAVPGFAYGEKHVRPAPQYGVQSEIHYGLRGNISWAETRVVVDVYVHDLTADIELWHETYRRSAEDFPAVQAEIAARIVSLVRPLGIENEALRVAAVKSTSRVPEESIGAYEYHLAGQEQLIIGDRASNIRAKQYFERALSRDPYHAPSLAALARTYIATYRMGWSEAGPEVLRIAEDNASSALQLDPRNLDVLDANATVQLLKGDHEAALKYSRDAFHWYPNDPHARVRYALALSYSGETARALKVMTNAVDAIGMDLGRYVLERAWVHYAAGEFEEALALLEGHSPNSQASLIRALALHELGRGDDAVSEARTFALDHPRFSATALRRMHPIRSEGDFAKLAATVSSMGLQ